jgi:predicted nuclease of predicted toxin-antitoxin system
MKILVDMNLPADWVVFFAAHGIEAAHWSAIGKPDAKDREIMAWARERRYIVFTHDLDLAAIVATTNADGPSVLQTRTQDVLPGAIGRDILNVLRDHHEALGQGAIVTVDELKSRIRILPILKIEL